MSCTTEQDGSSEIERNMLKSFVLSFRELMDCYDPSMSGNSIRVAQTCMRIAARLGRKTEFIERLWTAAMLHDVGKIGISPSILNRSGKFTFSEKMMIRLHPLIGFQILNKGDFLEPIARIVRHHHERYDGNTSHPFFPSYPGEVRGGEIPEEARLIAIADTYDALSTDRYYRKKITDDSKIIRIFEENAGEQFDPFFSNIFVEMIRSREIEAPAEA